MTEILRPAADWELKSMLAQLGEQNLPVEIVGAGTKRAIGHPVIAVGRHHHGELARHHAL